jgi:nucleoside-diphosphate-sugar epimerase
MKSSIFITGASGFIGRKLLSKLSELQARDIYCLSRNDHNEKGMRECKAVRWIKGSLFDFDRFAKHLESCDTVIHMAALTGKAGSQEYFEVNARGTEFLIHACRSAQVRNFLYMSSIAVKFPDISRYYYAQSKQQAEEAVKRSGLRYTILRPTIVIGRDSSIWASLSKVAKAPVIPMFGDGKTKIQPIYVDDLADIIMAIIDNDNFCDRTYEVGGKDIVTMEQFLKCIHHFYYEKDPRVVHLPLKYVVPVLLFFEIFLKKFMPFNAGQLSSFANDGIVDESKSFCGKNPQAKDIKAMIALASGR